jgi:hypothetical protein
MAQPRPQKGKDHKRPRRFHRGRAQGKINDRLMRQKLEPAYAAAVLDRERTAASAASCRAERRDYEQLVAQLERVSPYVPAWDFGAALGLAPR